ncbi:hypothetical protein Tco_1495791, partial [Tanacetum coccineum]
DDDEDEEEDSSEDEDKEEEEHLALSDSNDVASPAVDLTPIPFPYEAEVARLLALTTPPPSSLTPVSSPLPQIPPPPTSPTYDQASLSSDIPKADILPQKRLILTNPTPWFEVGESSTATARQPRSTVAHRVDYSFLDTIDASIRASKRRTMAVRDHAALRDEVDTLRRYLSSLCTTHKQERVEARQALDRSEANNRSLEARIAVLETQAYHHEWQRQDADNHATGAMMRIHVLEARARIDTLEDTGSTIMYGMLSIMGYSQLAWPLDLYFSFLYQDYHKMPPKRNVAVITTTPMTDAQIKALIAQGVADALAERDANRIRNGDDSHDSKIGNQVKYATCTLLGNALTWWNSHIKTVGHDAAYGMP